MRIPDSLYSLVDHGIIEEVVRPLMSGKEAQVYLVVSGGEQRVAKIYKEAQNRTFQNRADYTEGRKVRNSRDQRAMSKGTRHGRAQNEAAWRSTEVDMIYRLRQAGVRVPVPHHFIDGVLIMELVCDEEGFPAPRLGDLMWEPEDAIKVYEHLLGEVVRMLSVGVVHGDLSDFNVLMAADGPVIIDFPQSVDASSNQNARKLLLRDVANLHRFLSKFAPERPALPYAEEMWELYKRNALTPDTRLTGRYRAAQKPASTEAVMGLIVDAAKDERRRREQRGLSMRGAAGSFEAGARDAERNLQGAQRSQPSHGHDPRRAQRGPNGAAGQQSEARVGQPRSERGGQAPPQRNAERGGGQPRERRDEVGGQSQRRDDVGGQRERRDDVHGGPQRERRELHGRPQRQQRDGVPGGQPRERRDEVGGQARERRDEVGGQPRERRDEVGGQPRERRDEVGGQPRERRDDVYGGPPRQQRDPLGGQARGRRDDTREGPLPGRHDDAQEGPRGRRDHARSAEPLEQRGGAREGQAQERGARAQERREGTREGPPQRERRDDGRGAQPRAARDEGRGEQRPPPHDVRAAQSSAERVGGAGEGARGWRGDRRQAGPREARGGAQVEQRAAPSQAGSQQHGSRAEHARSEHRREPRATEQRGGPRQGHEQRGDVQARLNSRAGQSQRAAGPARAEDARPQRGDPRSNQFDARGSEQPSSSRAASQAQSGRATLPDSALGSFTERPPSSFGERMPRSRESSAPEDRANRRGAEREAQGRSTPQRDSGRPEQANQRRDRGDF